MVNGGKRANINVGDYKFQARELDEGTVVPLGPESQLTVVVPKETASAYFPGAAGRADRSAVLSRWAIPISNFIRWQDHPPDERFVQVGLETWQPVLDMNEALDYGFTIPTADLPGTPEMREFELATLPVYTLSKDGRQRSRK